MTVAAIETWQTLLVMSPAIVILLLLLGSLIDPRPRFLPGVPPPETGSVFAVRCWGLVLVYWDDQRADFIRLDDQVTKVPSSDIREWMRVSEVGA